MEKQFSFCKEKFFRLVDLLQTTIGPNPNTPNFRSLSAAKKVAITLHYLKDMRSLGMTAKLKLVYLIILLHEK